jgi:hypothetical protein
MRVDKKWELAPEEIAQTVYFNSADLPVNSSEV